MEIMMFTCAYFREIIKLVIYKSDRALGVKVEIWEI